MSTTNIILIIFSGLGVIHGLFLATFLWIYPKGKRVSNRILSLLLVILSFRIGKSVLLEFDEIIDIKLIFIGLATIMAIGPLFYLYTHSLLTKEFQIKKKHLLHFIPSLIGICFGAWLTEVRIQSIPKVVFAILFLSYYGHYLTYLIRSFLSFSKKKKKGLSQDTYMLLRLLFYTLLALWVIYVLNLFDESIPYIVGPIAYTFLTYVVSFVIIQKGYIKTTGTTKYKSTSISEEQTHDIFSKVTKLVIDEKQFKNPDITLKYLSEQLHVSTQILSMVINKEHKTNFNSFINQHRVKESIKMFQHDQFENYTIAAIAFEVGFNSISSFNRAFKKQTEKTPLLFRKSIGK